MAAIWMSVSLGFGSVHEVRAFRERKRRSLWFRKLVELDVHPELTIEAVNLYKPDLIIAPFLKRKIPKEVWEKHLTLVVRPGPPGDRGPNALDWAILKGEKEWGVCIASVITEVMVFLSNGIEMGELRNQSFYPAFTTIMGPLGGMVFLHSEGLLDKSLMDYFDVVSENLWRALKA